AWPVVTVSAAAAVVVDDPASGVHGVVTELAVLVSIVRSVGWRLLGPDLSRLSAIFRTPICDAPRALCIIVASRIDGQCPGTARPFPLWRLRSGPYRRPSIRVLRRRI